MVHRLGRTHRDIDATHDRNQELKHELDLVGTAIDLLRTQISNQEREIDGLRDNLVTSDHSMDRAQDVLRTSEDALVTACSANADLDTLRTERDTLQTERDDTVAPSARLESELRRVTANLEQATATATQDRHDRDRISEGLTRAQEMYADVQEDITQLRDSQEDVDADLDQTAALLAEAAGKPRGRSSSKQTLS
ncbi:hypothetical protein PI124_g1336 [Phytophthora idaei]|nr:hypothetical protein PI125_g2994 [Phytophthora idaei]KAG3254095.1 hypothetical protein PI124_g1336 [Phytophthora idaei]